MAILKKISDYIDENNKKVWISITGYRTLLLFISLLEKPCSIDELVEIAKNNDVTSKSVSKDTIRLTLNTLKSAGCEITRPSKSNGFKYELVKHPFVLNVSEEDLDSLIIIRERIANELDWKKVLILNEFYEKFISLTKNDLYIEKIENTKPLNGINLEVLSQISNPKTTGKKVSLTYKSPEFGIEDLDVIVQKVVYENSKLYLWCYNYKYGKTGILNIERIVKINSVGIEKVPVKSNYYDVEYEVFGSIAKNFKPENDEEIIMNDGNKVIVKAKVYNEFWFMQRLLMFGSEFKIISPYFFKEKMINKIYQIRKGYTE